MKQLGNWKVIVRNLETIDFRTLSVFVTTCQQMNLTQCAELMGLPKSTVSKAITKLEDHLEVKLLERSTRKIQITEAGQIVFNRAAQLVNEFKALTQDVQEMEQQVQGMLRISAPPTLGGFFTNYVLSPFMKQWPKIKVSLELSYDFDDLFSQGIDLALRVGQVADDRLVAKEIGYSTRVLVASSAYLEAHGYPSLPSDLVHHNCLRFQGNTENTPWTLVSEEKTVSVGVSSNFSCSNMQGLKSAAFAGLGIAQIPANELVCEWGEGKLVRILPEWHAVPMPIYLVYRSGLNKPKRLEAILEHILSMKEQFRFGPELLNSPKCKY
ncbi:LysR family transcriptional regulator [Litoribrevibacter albus]|uniref:LysR family transcriptional regulator n=1 Tax=Litoribrevibacter albus TaxID=1473156 RepID=A0AA37S953_9GAMM|nr:LysR family transcriptional regulator [Litoribrevibacter albus]GLQ30392.1 LysR family transcriptional regulator [Litoribrevibacter albus]